MAEKTKFAQAGFRDEKGMVQGTGTFHDIDSLPADFIVKDEGFITHEGSFVTREEATAVIGADHPVQSEELDLVKSIRGYVFEGPVLDGSQHKVTVRSSEGKHVGELTVAARAINDPNNPHHGYHKIGAIEVSPLHRKKGLAGRMLQIAALHVKHSLKSKGLVSIGAWRSEAATGAWEKLAGKVKGIQKLKGEDPENPDFRMSEKETVTSPENEEHEFIVMLREWLKGRTIKKSHPTFTLPKLGMPDNRRETYIVDSPKELKTKGHALAHAAGKAIGPQYTSASTSTKKGFHTDFSAQMTGPGVGGAASATTQTAYAKGPSILAAESYRLKNPAPHENNNATLGIKNHEDMHLMFTRVEQKYGTQGRQKLVRNLFESIPKQYKFAVQQYINTRRPGLLQGPEKYEESLTHILNYLNNPGEREAYHTKLGHIPAQQQEFSTKMKRAHRCLLDAAHMADEKWVTQDLWKKWGATPDALRRSESELEFKDLVAQRNLSTVNQSDHKVAAHMSGFSQDRVPEFAAAQFLSKRKRAPESTVRQALVMYDHDIEMAALFAYGIPRNEKNREVLRGLVKMQSASFKKSDIDVAAIPREVKAITPEGEQCAEAIRHAYASGNVHEVHLNGKHSKGTAIAIDTSTKKKYLIKPGSGSLSPCLGVNEDAASQSRREVGFAHGARLLGLEDFVPHAELLSLDGNEVACLELLGDEYESMDHLQGESSYSPSGSLEPYRKDGSLFKWAVMDLLFGNPDRHNGNLMINSDGDIKLIDHGSCFAGFSFSPADDTKSFIPFYLRAWSHESFNNLTPDEKQELMPTVDHAAEASLSRWIDTIDENKIAYMLGGLGIHKEPFLLRLKTLKDLAPDERLRSVLAFWAGSQSEHTIAHEPKPQANNPTRHPNNYEWHDGHTDHHAGLAKADVAKHPHTDGAIPHNDQAAGKGVATYAKFAAPYGKITPGTKTNLLHYDYRPHVDKVNAAVKKHGFNVYIAGGKYGKPDLAKRNYNTGHLMIYDPTPGSGGDSGDEQFTTAWRTAHELAHAISYPELNAKYGEGRRIGKLGVHRSIREAKRAVEWEWMAAHKQREMATQMGMHVPDELFHRELNTVMHDAVHRAVTGQFTEPSDEGFSPHNHKVPLEHALKVIEESGRALGLTDENGVLKKSLQPVPGPTGAAIGKPAKHVPVQAPHPTMEGHSATPSYREVSPAQFEARVSQHPNQASLDSPRDYAGKRTFLADDEQSGYALHESGELNHVFSFVPGMGSHAVNHAIQNGAVSLSAFDGKLPQYYSRFGFKEYKRDANWTPGGPDVVFMRKG